MHMRNQMHCARACTCTSSHRRRGAPSTEPMHTSSLPLQPLLHAASLSAASAACGDSLLLHAGTQASGASPSSCTSTAVRRRCSSCPTSAATRRARRRRLCRVSCRSWCTRRRLVGPPTETAQARGAAPRRLVLGAVPPLACRRSNPRRRAPPSRPPTPALLITTDFWWGIAGGRPLLSRARASALLITPSGGDRPPRRAYRLERASRSRP